MSIVRLIAAAAALLVSGCAERAAQLQPAQSSALPPLATLAASRTASEPGQISLPQDGADAVLLGPGATVDGTAMQLDPGPEQLSFAVYRFDVLDTQPVFGLHMTTSGGTESTQRYLGFANYTRGKWQLHGHSPLAGYMNLHPFEDQDQFSSGTNTFVVFAAWDGAGYTVEDMVLEIGNPQ